MEDLALLPSLSSSRAHCLESQLCHSPVSLLTTLPIFFPLNDAVSSLRLKFCRWCVNICTKEDSRKSALIDACCYLICSLEKGTHRQTFLMYFHLDKHYERFSMNMFSLQLGIVNSLKLKSADFIYYMKQ